MTTKTCRKCKEIKPVTRFYCKPDGHTHSYCAECMKTDSKARWNRNKIAPVVKP